MKQILKYIKENSFYIILFIIFISFLLINIKVVYFGDDYVYLTFRNLNITDYFSKLWGHYLHTNGRFIVHLLVTLFLKMPIIVFQIVNSLLLTGICYFGTTIVLSTDNYQNKNKRSFVLIIMFLLIASLGISIMRESVFWLTGSFNYVYPCFMLLAYWTVLLKIDNKKYFVLAIILGFLSSSTVEQNALMTFGLTLLTFLIS